MAKPRSDLYYRLEYTAFRIVETILKAMPIGAAIVIGRLIGYAWWFFDKRHRQIAHEHLLHAFGDKLTEARRQEIIRGVYLHFVMVAVEVTKFAQVINRSNWRQHIDLRGKERLDEALARGNGVVVVTGHLGNFELSSYILNLSDPPMLAVGRQLDNPYLDKHLWASRERIGQRVINKRGGLRQMAMTLRRGEVIGFVADQDAGKHGVFVDLFGREASTYPSFASLALRAKAPIIPGYACRVGQPMRYRLYLDRPIEPVDTGDRERDIRNILQEYNHRLEKYVTEFPEQWLWTYRRWKTRPPGEIENP